MNRIDDYNKLVESISEWIKVYAIENNIEDLIIGISGGIDSAVVSTLCARTGLNVVVCNIQIESNEKNDSLAKKQIEFLKNNFKNVVSYEINNTISYNEYILNIGEYLPITELCKANTKSRLRMVTLYNVASMFSGIVVGTGNKVEDFGIGFFTKYGDGGVDISPIADLYKTEVRQLALCLNIPKEIVDAKPTDGLWDDNRTDEDQIGATYEELEQVMENKIGRSKRMKEVKEIYESYHNKNKHKINPIPVYFIKNKVLLNE